jgi:phosphoribosylaminoimidazolecarboxamide formyltransferase/IMP cyclohydrolase
MTRRLRALLSVHDKTGIVELARGLRELGFGILSTGGTARLLGEAGIEVSEVADVTGFPEILDGRVKTLHPGIHAGILARRDVPGHLAALAEHGIRPIDLVAVTLYPFEATVARPGITPREAIEQIDVGGPAMIRAAAKNHAGVAILTDPAQYAPVLDELRRGAGTLSPETRERLAVAAFRRTSEYDAAIAAYLAALARSPELPPRAASPGEAVGSQREVAPRVTPASGREVLPDVAGTASQPADGFPPRLVLEADRLLALRYGENPHQRAALYRDPAAAALGVSALTQLHGPELSYNNVLDLSAALGLLAELDAPAAVVVKHTNPCGVALGSTAGEAVRKAKASDPVSIYGGIVGVNLPVDRHVVAELAGIFVEILFAPGYEPDALEELRRTKRKARVLEVSPDRARPPVGLREYRSVLGGVLVQTADLGDLDPAALTVVSRRAPTAGELAALRFAWRVAKHAKSNAIVLATADQVIGVGAGQMNRVDSARIALMRAREFALETKGAVCASDAFFPFRDGLDVVAAAGVTAAIHPGGSVRDAEVIAAADEHDMALVTTGIRHFRH